MARGDLFEPLLKDPTMKLSATRTFLFSAALVAAPLLLRSAAAQAPVASAPASAVAVTVKAGEVGPPINPFIYGQFIEHLGRCIYGGIWAEMLEDRKFYFPVTAEYRPYRSLRNTPFPVVGASPWEILGEAGQVTMETARPFVGRHSPRLAPGAGIRQNDLGVVAGKAYTGYLWLEADGPGASVEVALVWGDGPGDRQAVRIENVPATYARHALTFTAGARTDKARLEVRAGGGQPVRVGTISLMPADNVRGMRADTLALLKQLGGTMYRWPGGNFVSGYDWRDGLGDRDRRPPRRNPAWTGVEHNDFGLHEFLDFCREIGTEPVIAVNTGLGDAHSAALEVEYCNGATDTPGGAWRARNGRTEPFGVKYWCVGNEMWGTWQLGFMQLKHYTFKHNQVADAMWKADPALQLIGSGQLGWRNPKHDPDQRVGWSEGMLAECADRMNLISEHFYCQEKPDLVAHVRQVAENIRQKAEGERKVQKDLGLIPRRPIPIAMDEWNYWYGPHLYGELGTRYFLKDALGIAMGLHEYTRHTDIIQMAHYAQTVNVIGCIKTTKTEAFLDATALPLMLYRHRYGTLPLTVTPAGDLGGLDVAAAWTPDRKAITIGVVNPGREPRSIAIAFEGATPGKEGTSWTIAGDDPGLYNEPGQARLAIVEAPVAFDGLLTVPPLSSTVVRLPAP